MAGEDACPFELARRRFLRGQISWGYPSRVPENCADEPTSSSRAAVFFLTGEYFQLFVSLSLLTFAKSQPLGIGLDVPCQHTVIDFIPTPISSHPQLGQSLSSYRTRPQTFVERPAREENSPQATRRRILREAWRMHTPSRLQRRSNISR
jgi:hypothetical protein